MYQQSGPGGHCQARPSLPVLWRSPHPPQGPALSPQATSHRPGDTAAGLLSTRHSPALPGHGPHQAGPTSRPSLRPPLCPPGRCHVPGLQLPTVHPPALLLDGEREGVWLTDPAQPPTTREDTFAPSSMVLRELLAHPSPGQRRTPSFCGC